MAGLSNDLAFSSAAASGFNRQRYVCRSTDQSPSLRGELQVCERRWGNLIHEPKSVDEDLSNRPTPDFRHDPSTFREHGK